MPGHFRQDLRQAFYDHRLLLACGGFYSLLVTAMAFRLHVPWNEFSVVLQMVGLSVLSYIVYFFCLFIFYGLRAAYRAARGRAPFFRAAYNSYMAAYDAYWNSKLPAYSVAGFFGLAFLNFFFAAKCLMRFIAPYHAAGWDPVLSRLDHALAFGRYPHEWVIPLVNGLHLSRVLNDAYALWFILMVGMPAYAILADPDLQRRMRFMWSYFLNWVVMGTFMALALSSVGPTFYGHFYPELQNPYAAINANLAAIDPNGDYIMTFGIQRLLAWQDNGRMINDNAISAMPSLHIAMCLLIVLYARSVSRRLLWPMLAFLAAIFTASVYFGMHYAVDGYVAIVTGCFIWWLSGKLARRLHPHPETLIPA